MTVQKNGAALAAKTTAPTPTASPEKLPPAPLKAVPKDLEDKLPPLEDRLHRLNQLFHIQSKYNRLQESLQKLQDFEVKKDGERSRITIADDNRNDFSTYNGEIITEVVDFLKSRIREKIKALEPQLKW